MNKIWRNRALLAIGLSIIALALFAIQHYGVYDFRALFSPAPEQGQGWDHIAAGDRIEEATGLDVLHVGPIGLPPPRELASSLTISVLSERFSGTIGEDTHLYDDLGMAEDDVKWIRAQLGLALIKMKYGGSLPERTIRLIYSDGSTEEYLTIGGAFTVGELVDCVVENYRQSMGLLGATPRFHVAVIYKSPDTHGDKSAARITGYKPNGVPTLEILEPEEYTWNEAEALEEDSHTRFNVWTMEKWKWYNTHKGLFPPGKHMPARIAVAYLDNYLTVKHMMTPLFNAIIAEAFRYEEATGGRFWRMIEIDYLMLSPLQTGLGVDSTGKPGFVAYTETLLIGTRFVFRARSMHPTPESTRGWWGKDHYLDRAFEHEGRELTVDEVVDMIFNSSGSIYQPSQSIFGPLPYIYGVNHPWRHDDLPS